MYLFKSISGTFVFNQNFKIREKEELKNTVDKFLKKFKKIEYLNETKDIEKTRKCLFEMREFKENLIKENLKKVKKDIKKSVNEDIFIIQTINTIDDLNKIINMLSKRLREWYSYYFPELNELIYDNIKFAKLISKSKKDLMKKFEIKGSMGPDLDSSFVKPMQKLSKEILSLDKLRHEKEKYLEEIMEKVCPNLKKVAGALIGAKLLSISGSLRKLMLFPASTIQLLGAEEALFKHIRTGSKPPKYGVLFAHQWVQKSPAEKKGRAARIIADKISMAAKVDYFQGKFVGDKLVKQIEEKLEI